MEPSELTTPQPPLPIAQRVMPYLILVIVIQSFAIFMLSVGLFVVASRQRPPTDAQPRGFLTSPPLAPAPSPGDGTPLVSTPPTVAAPSVPSASVDGAPTGSAQRTQPHASPAARVPTDRASATQRNGCGTASIHRAAVTLRGQPQDTAAAIGTIAQGTGVTVLCVPAVRSGATLWYRIRSDAREGWVRGDDLALDMGVTPGPDAREPRTTQAAMPLTPTPSAPPADTYVFPVRGATCTYAAVHHDYPATDIFCPEGSAYVAVTSGVVEFISPVDRWNAATDVPAERGGIMISMVGDDGVRYYGSHLSAIADGLQPGVRVAAGELLGYTGKSGNAASTPPHVHFGISRPTTPEDWQTRRGEVSPYAYLRAWEQGRMMTPDLTEVVP